MHHRHACSKSKDVSVAARQGISPSQRVTRTRRSLHGVPPWCTTMVYQPPKFFKPRSVPYALMRKVEEELDRWVQTKVIEPECYSDWATLIVPVLKTDGKVRIWGDYKLTVNRVSHLEQHPFPTLGDLCEKLAGGKQFTKLDLSHAYSQHPLDKSKEYVTVNTHKGLFRYNILLYGISSALVFFQRTMENILHGLPHIAVY